MANTPHKSTHQHARKSWDRAFIASLRITGNITLACEAAKVDRSTPYLRRKSDTAFAAEWDEALEESADRLEAEARRRAEQGVLKPVWHKGVQVGTELEYSDTLMALLLKAHKPEKYRERQDITSGGEKLPIAIVKMDVDEL